MNDGVIEVSDGHVTFHYERELPCPVDVVWRAITDASENESWFGGRIEIELQPGGQFISHHQGGMRVVDRIVRVEPPTLLEHTFWLEINPSALVTWELHPTVEGCLFSLTHSLSMDDTRSAAVTVASGDDPSVIIARNAAGWHHLLDKLEAKLEGRTLGWSEENRRALLDRYASMLTRVQR